MTNETPLAKREDESDFQHHKRLVYGKLIDKTLSDYDYTELSKYVYGKEYSADVARRLMYGSQKTLELFQSDVEGCISDNDVLSELDIKLIELKKESKKISDQRRELNKIIINEGRNEHLYNRLVDAADSLNETIGDMYGEEDIARPDRIDNSAVLIFSDWHYGMVEENIYNKFNTEICKKRVAYVTGQAIERIVSHNCKIAHIVVIGDLYHGAIHTSARVASEELVCDQLMQSAELLAQSINFISKYVDHVYVHMTYGNHARTIQSKNDSIHKDNMEKIIPWWLSERFKNKDTITVEDNLDNEFLCFCVNNHYFCASHGDLDSVKKSPRLLYTLFNKKYGIDLEYIILGDKHHAESFEELGVTATICGSLCGSDDYANNNRLYSTPSQLLLIVNDDNGVDAEYRIKCK